MSGAAVLWAGVAGVFVLGVASTRAGAQTRDGSFAGMIQCEALPGLRPLRTQVTMTVAAGQARYEREIQHPTGGPSGIFERGEGPIGPAGEVTLRTRAAAPGYSYEAEYKGRIEETTAASPARSAGSSGRRPARSCVPAPSISRGSPSRGGSRSQ